MIIRLQEAIGVSSLHTRVLSIGNDMMVLFSYETPVAMADHTGLYRTEKKWSVTTSRHINQWLNGREATVVSQDELEARIERTLQGAYHKEGRKAR